MAFIRQRHQRLNRRGVRRIENDRSSCLARVNYRRRGDPKGLHVGCVTAVGAHKSVLTNIGGVQEFLTPGATHRAGIGLHDHILKAQPLENALVGVSL